MEKKYYSVTFQHSVTTYCTNIAIATCKEDVEMHYSKYEWVSISEATENEVVSAKRKGMPIIECEHVEPQEEAQEEEQEEAQEERKEERTMKNVLYLLEMGMNDESLCYDVKNHRVRVIEWIKTTLRDEPMFFEFIECTVRKMRYTHKVTGKQLKHPIYEVVNPCGLYIDTQYDIPEGSYRDSKIEREVWENAMNYSKKSILEVVNSVAIKKYDSVVLVEEEAKKIALSLGGYREKAILENDPVFVVTETWNENRKVVEVFERINHKLCNSFEVDLVSKKIVG